MDLRASFDVLALARRELHIFDNGLLVILGETFAAAFFPLEVRHGECFRYNHLPNICVIFEYPAVFAPSSEAQS